MLNDILSLTEDLCAFAIGVVADENRLMFDRIAKELPIQLYRYRSGETYNGWVVPKLWRVKKATIAKDGALVFDGKSHTFGVTQLSKPFTGEIELEELDSHIVTNKDLPEAYMFHCMWQYRPWDADWAFSIPYKTYKTFSPGRYVVDLKTTFEDGEMLVAEYEHQGTSSKTIVFNCHTCHPHQANDAFAGVAILIRLFQWLRDHNTYYTYRLVLGPEHLGTVFYLRDKKRSELERIISGVFTEMPGTPGPIKAASTFLGDQVIDKVFSNVLRHYSRAYELVPWRKGAGNDETVWEAPGYEVPFVEVTRSHDLFAPYREYHTSLDTPELMDETLLDEFYTVLKKVIEVLEYNARVYRKFDGLICLSNPAYNLYMERPDPAVKKDLEEDSEKWGILLDSLLRYFDGSLTILDIAEKHDLPFDRLYSYLLRFQEKNLIRLEFAPIERVPISKIQPEM